MVKSFANRGFSSKYAENTHMAFVMSIATQGCDGIFLNVHLSKDGEVIIIHDETLDRTSLDMKGKVSDYTLEDLKKADVSANFPTPGKPQHIMTLKEYLDMMKISSDISFIELKNDVEAYEGLEEKVAQLVQEANVTSKVQFAACREDSLLKMKALLPDAKIYQIIGSDTAKLDNKEMTGFIADFEAISPEIAAKFRESEQELYAIHITDKPQIRAMLRAEVTGIITSIPDVVNMVRIEKPDDYNSEDDWPIGWSFCGWLDQIGEDLKD